MYNGKELNEDFGLDWSDYGARWYDASIGRWNAVDPLAESYSSFSPYNYVLGNPISLVDPDGKAPEEYPIVTITKQKAGTAAQRVIGTSDIVQTDLYKVVVTDTEDSNFRREFSVTRDAWVDANPGSGVASNVGFEPKDANNNSFIGKVRSGGYPDGNGTQALKLTQKGSEEVHAEPNQTAVDLGSRDKVNTAKGIMVHVAGNYNYKGKSKVAASLGCFGVCHNFTSANNPSNDHTNRVMSAIINQANKSQTNPGKIEVVIEKREGNEYPKNKNF